MRTNTPVTKYASYTSATGDQTAIWAMAAGETAYITDVVFSTSGAQVWTLKVGGATKLVIRQTGAGSTILSLSTPISANQGDDVVINLTNSVSNGEVTITGYASV